MGATGTDVLLTLVAREGSTLYADPETPEQVVTAFVSVVHLSPAAGRVREVGSLGQRVELLAAYFAERPGLIEAVAAMVNARRGGRP